MATLIQNKTEKKYSRTRFDGFGPSILIQQTRGRIKRNELPSDRLEGRRLLREQCPLTPGVYGWLNEDKQLLYVGKSKSLRTRLLSYFAKNPTEPKMERIRQQSKYLIWEPISDELLALIREQELIFRWTPEFNSQGQPNRRLPAFLCISDSLAANLFVTKQLTSRVAKVFGPITGTGKLSEAAICCNYLFGLRDCPDKTKFEFNNQLQLFNKLQSAKCIRHELGSCLAPCAGRCSKSEYKASLSRALDFLEGRDRSVVKQLEQEMLQAARRERYEQAAVLRDRFKSVRWLDRQLAHLRNCKTRLNGILPIQARRARTVWLVLRGGRLVSNTLKPTNRSQAKTVAQDIRRLAKQSCETPSNRLDIKMQLIVSSWFRKHKDWYNRLIDFDQIESFNDKPAGDRV